MNWTSVYSNQKVWTSEYIDMVVWYSWLKSLCDFLWIGQIVGNDLISETDGRKIAITGKDFITTYIPYSSVATFKLPLDPDFVADDTDGLWFTGGVQNSVTTSNLVDTDFARSIIKFQNEDPYDISAIAILKSTVTLTSAQIDQLSQTFYLWLFWSGFYNDNGYLKDNRLLP